MDCHLELGLCTKFGKRENGSDTCRRNNIWELHRRVSTNVYINFCMRVRGRCVGVCVPLGVQILRRHPIRLDNCFWTKQQSAADRGKNGS
jgi:hypothetical protein